VIRSRHFVAWVILCGTAFGSSTPTGDRGPTGGAAFLKAGAAEPAIASVAGLAGVHLGLPEPTVVSSTMSVGKTATPDPDPRETAVPATEEPASETPSVASAPTSPEAQVPLAQVQRAQVQRAQVQLASVSTSDPMQESPKPTVRPDETPDQCLVTEGCVDEYLWSLYQRAPKVDVNKVTKQTKETVTKNGKTRTIIKTTTEFVLGDFTWKDPKAAERVNMPLKDYVIGGLDPGFKVKLYHALRAMDDAGFMPGITSAFRDDYRQSIASGNVAASDRSYHGGSSRGGYGHALAADIVSVKGENRMQRTASSEELWKWIDAHEKELGIGRPYLDRDPPHVGPIDGQEYADKRGRTAVQKLGLPTKHTQEAGLAAKKRPVKIVSTHRRAPQLATP
jgi:hypothetical protein